MSLRAALGTLRGEPLKRAPYLSLAGSVRHKNKGRRGTLFSNLTANELFGAYGRDPSKGKGEESLMPQGRPPKPTIGFPPDHPEHGTAKDEQIVNDHLFNILSFKKVARLRTPATPAPTTHLETWVPATHVSPVAEENVLQFRTRYVLTANGKQPPWQSKVSVKMRVASLGLSPKERNRLVAVAGQRYNHETDVLKLVSNTHKVPAENKREIRQTLDRLLEDARANAESHAQLPDSELPLNCRSQPWHPHTFGAQRGQFDHKQRRLKPQRARTPRIY